MTVNDLRKNCDDGEVVALAKTLIKNWKKYLPASNNKSDTTSSSQESKSSHKSSPALNSKDSKKHDSHKSDKDHSKHSGSHSKEQSGYATTDAVRLKCREMLAAAIKVDGGTPEGEHFAKLP